VSELFREGGPHNIRRTGTDQYEMSVALPADADGMLERECKRESCAPALFKVRPGTGLSQQPVAYCPYCRHAAEPNDFTTAAQKEYAIALAKGEALVGVDRMVRKALGIGPSNRRKLAEGLISMTLEYTPPRKATVLPPVGEELRRDVVCPHCTLAQAVYGLAVWCPDCGRDIFVTHVEQEAATISKMLTAIPQRLETLGPRVAARDLENCLEDLVSIFEASLKALTKRHLVASGKDAASVEATMGKTVRNRYQSPTIAAECFKEITGLDLLSRLDVTQRDSMARTFAKRHPITHNLGVVDRKYLEQVQSAELEGRDVRLTESDVEESIALALDVIRSAHYQLFP